MKQDRSEYLRLYRIRNAESIRRKRRAAYLATKDSVKQKNKDRYARNAERYRAEKRAWRAANPDRQKEIAHRCYLNTKAKRRDRCKRWERANPEKVRAQASRKYQKNRVKILARTRAYEQANRDKINARRRRKYYADPAYRIKKNLARRLSKKLADAGKRWSPRTIRLVGCNVAFLRSHLESFQPGMTWQNYGQWEVDHKMPCANFDLSDPVQQAACFHFTNLQPLWSSENRSKGARLIAA